MCIRDSGYRAGSGQGACFRKQHICSTLVHCFVNNCTVQALQERPKAVSYTHLIASVDVKQDEPAVLGLKQVFCMEPYCEQRFYTPEQLNQVPGDFKESAFVKRQIGVGNVCERACLLYTSRCV